VPCLDYSIYHYYNNHRDSPAVSDNRSVFISLLLTPQGSVALKKSNGYYTFKASVSFLAHSICPTPILVNEKLATGLPVTFQASVWRSTIRPIRVTPCAHVHPSYRAFGDLHVVLLFIWQLQAQRLQEHKIFEQGTVSRSQAYRVLPIHSFVRIPHFHSTGTIQFNSTQAVHRHNSSSPVVPPAILQQFSLSFPPFFLVEKKCNLEHWRLASGDRSPCANIYSLSISPPYPSPPPPGPCPSLPPLPYHQKCCGWLWLAAAATLLKCEQKGPCFSHRPLSLPFSPGPVKATVVS